MSERGQGTRRVTLVQRYPRQDPPVDLEVVVDGAGLSVRMGEGVVRLEVRGEGTHGWCEWQGRILPYVAAWNGEELYLWLAGRQYVFERAERSERRDRRAGPSHAGDVRAPMPGKVLRVLVRAGDTVGAGQPLVVLESMKMEQTLVASHAGRIERVLVQEGAVVQAQAVLVELGPSHTLGGPP